MLAEQGLQSCTANKANTLKLGCFCLIQVLSRPVVGEIIRPLDPRRKCHAGLNWAISRQRLTRKGQLMPSAPAKTENAGRGARLDSWKEIAAYLGKADRTVKRWEKERGLPAHRLPGLGNASVYAYKIGRAHV